MLIPKLAILKLRINMKNNSTHIAVLLDRSGSMCDIRDAAIEGTNGFIDNQKDAGSDVTFSLVIFDANDNNAKAEHTEDWYFRINWFDNINKAVKLDRNNYVPRGGTALLDAMARLINETGAELAAMAEDDRPSKVIIVVNTDGYENSSEFTTKTSLAELIKHQSEKYNWKFLFLGANQDAILSGAEFGISAQSSMSYNANARSIGQVFQVTSQNVKEYIRTGDESSLDFTEEQRQSVVDSN